MPPHRKKKEKDRRKTWPILTGWLRSQTRHTPIPQTFVALHGTCGAIVIAIAPRGFLSASLFLFL
jgi:hypothetical protein